MKSKTFTTYFSLALLLFVLLNIPSPMVDKIRSKAIPPFVAISDHLKQEKKLSPLEEKCNRLELENQTLKNQVRAVREWLRSEERLEDQLKSLKNLSEFKTEDFELKQFTRRRSDDLCGILSSQLFSIQAQVIFREPVSWSSAVWIDRGLADNKRLGKQIIAEDSPVVVGHSIVGVVEYVGEKRSRVRLISDHSLTPSVRAVRGSEQSRMLLEHVEILQDHLKLRKDIFGLANEYNTIFQELKTLESQLKKDLGDRYLAKGLLQGSSAPLWRSRKSLLKGRGFNYDTSDREGPSRDLHGGSLLSFGVKANPDELLKVGDLLVTLGMDGIFPPGFHVATVSKIFPLKEGGFAYDIEAKPTAGNLDELSFVQVLPPLA
jgi:cell shape-determining protein MreC